LSQGRPKAELRLPPFGEWSVAYRPARRLGSARRPVLLAPPGQSRRPRVQPGTTRNSGAPPTAGRRQDVSPQRSGGIGWRVHPGVSSRTPATRAPADDHVFRAVGVPSLLLGRIRELKGQITRRLERQPWTRPTSAPFSARSLLLAPKLSQGSFSRRSSWSSWSGRWAAPRARDVSRFTVPVCPLRSAHDFASSARASICPRTRLHNSRRCSTS
jgi:hypothetical protein